LEAVADTTGCGESKPADVVAGELAKSSTALQSIAKKSDAGFLPVVNEICFADTCATNDGTRWIYRDGLHISNGQSSRLAPLLALSVKPRWAYN
jgi:hypothetical protein